MTKTIRDLKRELDTLQQVWRHPEVLKLREKILKENKPQIENIEKQIKELQSKVIKKARFPEDVPQNVLDVCNEYWKETTEYYKFRIHIWNDKAVWTSYPSGGYTTNAGFNPTPALFLLISLIEKQRILGREVGKVIFELTGRNSEKKLLMIMEEKTKGKNVQ